MGANKNNVAVNTQQRPLGESCLFSKKPLLIKKTHNSEDWGGIMMHDSEFRKYFLPGRINIILYTGRGRRGNDLSETRRSSISQESVFVPGGDCGGFTENAILSLCSLYGESVTAVSAGSRLPQRENVPSTLG